MIRRFLPACLLGALIAGAAPAAASVMGEGECEGLGVHAAWLDWGTGYVSVAVFNHTGDGRWPPRAKRFRVAYADGGATVASELQTLPSLKPVNVRLFDYRKLGGDFDQFQGERLLASGRVRLIDCASAEK